MANQAVTALRRATLATGQGRGQLPAGEVAGAKMLEHLTGLAVLTSRALQVERIDVTLAGERRAVEGGARELAIPGGRKGEWPPGYEPLHLVHLDIDRPNSGRE